ncbi:MAG: tRNA (adenosine(37)-N6)-threonylcarbamoyltransferase complex transferase subunit TsaD [candidate division Zixibacteria bacterium]|nr:tRNA (adenosine(37)-N6)-threonylcarbamoyltransferase complex transferase subunit TsaD [candidate division Zixibacteria bacterium]
MKVLGIETSCDETAASVVDGEAVLSSIVSSQEVHGKYGGIVPELAAREQLTAIRPVVRAALAEAGVEIAAIEGLAVTSGPGLAGSLAVGVAFAKSLALASGKPLVGVNHLEGHLFSVFIERPDFPMPAVVLIASGGHTALFSVAEKGKAVLLGQTVDDAAGEAFDKGARLLGLPYPGGPSIQKAAEKGNPKAVEFPRPMLKAENLEFSFAGLKTALAVFLQKHPEAAKERRADLAAAYQEAIVETLVEKSLSAAERVGARTVAVAGGVAANRRLRELLSLRAERKGLSVQIPALPYCTDNAAMIAFTGAFYLQLGKVSGPELEATPNLPLFSFAGV